VTLGGAQNMYKGGAPPSFKLNTNFFVTSRSELIHSSCMMDTVLGSSSLPMTG